MMNTEAADGNKRALNLRHVIQIAGKREPDKCGEVDIIGWKFRLSGGIQRGALDVIRSASI